MENLGKKWRMEDIRRESVMGAASVLAQMVWYVLSDIKRYELMLICVQHHEYPVVENEKSIAVGSTDVLYFRRESRNNTVAE